MLKYKLKYKSIHIRTNINTFMKTSSDWASKFEREAAKMKSSLEKRWGEIRGKWEKVNIPQPILLRLAMLRSEVVPRYS